MGSWLLPLGSVLLAVALIGGNVARYIGAEPKQRLSQNLNYLPDPTVARATAIGHRNLASRLQWLNSFTYVSYQIEARNDTVSGDGRGGFERLYSTLIELDPKFEPYYDHAAMTLSGIVADKHAALVILLRGCHELPQSFARWQNLLAHLAAYYELETRNRALFETLLRHWAEHMQRPEMRQVPERWLQAVARRQGGLSQIDYWAHRLQQAKPRSKMAQLAESILREQIVKHQLAALQSALTVPPPPEQRPLLLSDLDQRALPAPNPLGPLATRDGQDVLLTDPWGWPFFIDPQGQVHSRGQDLDMWQRQIATLNSFLAVRRERGEVLESLDDIRAAGLDVPEIPADCTMVLEDARLLVETPESGTAWNLRKLLAERR